MFVGHFGLGFGAKKAAPAVSLGTLFVACQFADLLWPTLVLLGYERVEVQPGATQVTPLELRQLSVLAQPARALRVGRRCSARSTSSSGASRISAAVTVALLVVSHWVLDYVTHRPDMPLTLDRPDAPRPRPLELDARHAGRRVDDLRRRPRCCICARRWRAIGSGRSACGRSSRFCSSSTSRASSVRRRRRAARSRGRREAMWLLVVWGYWVDKHRIPHRNRG